MRQQEASGKADPAEEVEKDDREHPHTEYRNNPKKMLKLRIDTNATKEECHSQIGKIVDILCPFLLRNGEDCPFRIKPLTGGLSNHLFLVSNSNFSSDADGTTGVAADTARTNTVLVRIHPDADCQSCNNKEEEAFSVVDREFEPKFASWLASQREDLPHNRGTMAPTVYGRFENGRVEEFYTNVRPLVCAEMKTYAPWIAQSLASFHSLDSPPEDVLPPPPIDDGTSSATIYKTIRSWLIEASKAQLDSNNNKFRNELSQEWDWLETILAKPPQQQSFESSDNSIVAEALEFIRRTTIAHMDCQPLNILINREDIEDNCDDTVHTLNTLRLIDFEYSGWNPIAADIANTFCEYCEMSNLRADYEKEYPTPAQQDTFFWNYLLQSNPTRAKQFSSYSWRQDGMNIDDNPNDCDTEWQLFSSTLQQEVGRFSLLSHLGWAIWSIIKAQEEDGIDFDYMTYARHRMDGYTWAKKKFCTAADNN